MPSSFLITAFCLSLFAQDSDIHWLEGAAWERAARKNPVSADWVQAPLGSQLRTFSNAQRIAIFLDRRIDPTQLVDMRVSELTLEQFLWTLADKLDLGVCQVDNLFYLGPKEVASSLPSLIDNLKKRARDCPADESRKRSLVASCQIKQPVPFDPREALIQLASDRKLPIRNIQKLPMDYWRDLDWPKTPALDCVCLIAVGFDTWVEIDDAGDLSLTDFPHPTEVTREFKGLGNAAALIDQLNGEFPQLDAVAASGSIRVTAAPGELSRVERWIVQQQRPTKVSGSEQRFTLKTLATRATILNAIASQMAIKLTIDDSLQKTLDDRIEIDVRNVTIQELLFKTLEGTNIDYFIQPGELKLSPREFKR